MTELLKSLQESGLAQAIRTDLFLFPMIEITHVIALTLVFGTVLIVDLRILGIASIDRTVRKVEADVLKWTWAGFAIALVTGSLMFLSNATGYAKNLPFLLKLGLLFAAGLNLLVFELTTRKKLDQWDQNPSGPKGARISALLSILLWTGVIVTGRWIGFTTTQRTDVVEAPPPEMDFDDFLGGGDDVFPADGEPADEAGTE